MSSPIAREAMPAVVAEVLQATPFIDVHTHLFPPSFGSIGLWGIDNLLTYHYLEAELFRFRRTTPDEYWAMDVPARADVIWRTLFVEETPLSEAARGVVAVLQAFGLDPTARTLGPAREFFRAQTLGAHVSRVFALAGISEVVMTNDPLDPDEWPSWERGASVGPAFHAALRIDRILNEWPSSWREIARRGYDVDQAFSNASVPALRRFLADCVARMRPLYMAVSLPDTFEYPVDDLRTRLLCEAVLPACREGDLPLALMIGVRRQVNPAIRLAGDAVGKADLHAVEHLLREWPQNRFLSTVLSRENQHELCVYARKFSNLLPFGCWWFLNNPSIVEEMTRERIEMIGATFIPQHSDARVLEQVIYKWRNTRRTMAPILAGTYTRLVEDGRPVVRADIERDVRRLFRTNLEEFTGRPELAARPS